MSGVADCSLSPNMCNVCNAERVPAVGNPILQEKKAAIFPHVLLLCVLSGATFRIFQGK